MRGHRSAQATLRPEHASCRLLVTERAPGPRRTRTRADANERTGHAPFYVSAVLDLAGELAAGRRDVVAAGAANRRDEAAVLQHARKDGDAFRWRTLQAGLRKRIERNQVEFARQAPTVEAGAGHEREELRRLCRRVVHAVEHAVLEGDEVARRLH